MIHFKDISEKTDVTGLNATTSVENTKEKGARLILRNSCIKQSDKSPSLIYIPANASNIQMILAAYYIVLLVNQTDLSRQNSAYDPYFHQSPTIFEIL